jgi:hypothetical protein
MPVRGQRQAQRRLIAGSEGSALAPARRQHERVWHSAAAVLVRPVWCRNVPL